MTVKELIDMTETDLITVWSNFHGHVLPVSRAFFVKKYDFFFDANVCDYSVQKYDGNFDDETILTITI